MASRRRSSPPTGKPLKYQAMCLRRSAQPRAPRRTGRRAARRAGVRSRPPRPAWAAPGSVRPANASARSRNSQGRPRQPRPMTTPSTPVSATIRSASAASQMSPLPSTGMDTAALRRGDGGPVGLAGVGLLRRTPVQRDRRTAGVLGDPAGVQEGLVVGVDADPGLDRHRHPVRLGRPHRRLEDHRQPVPLVGQRRSPTLAGHLGHRAAEVEVDVAHAVLGDQDPGRLAP